METPPSERPTGSRHRTDLEPRTLLFSVNVVRFVSALPRSDVTSAVGRQLLKSATSIGANHREANRAESRDDFIRKTAIAQKEAAETDYWLELCRRTQIGPCADVEALAREARELLAMFTTINRKAKGR